MLIEFSFSELFVGINVYDLIVIYPKMEDFLSFADVGHKEKLRHSTAWIPPYKQIQQIKKLVKAQAISKNTRKIAKQMIKNKFDPKIISSLTGLSLGEIERL